MAKRIKIASDQRPFVMAYWDFIESNLFDWNEKRLVIILKKFADSNNQCFPSIKTLCKFSQLSKMTVLKALRSLEEKKVITIEHREDADNNRSQSNLYTLYDYPEIWNAESVELIKETVDIEELRLFELAKKKGYQLIKEKELETTVPTKATADSSTQKSPSKEDNTKKLEKSQDLEQYTLEQIHNLLNYDDIINKNSEKKEKIDSIINILHTYLNTNKNTLRINGMDMPAKVVISRLSKLSGDDILYAIEKYEEQSEIKEIRNTTGYIMTILYKTLEQKAFDLEAILKVKELLPIQLDANSYKQILKAAGFNISKIKAAMDTLQIIGSEDNYTEVLIEEIQKDASETTEKGNYMKNTCNIGYKDFHQRSYDYDELERILLNSQQNHKDSYE